MILTVRGWPKRRGDTLESGDRQGATIAQADLVQAALQYNIVDRIDVLIDDSSLPVRSQRAAGAIEDGVGGELVRQFGRARVRIISAQNLDTSVKKKDCIFLGAGPELLNLAMARSYLPFAAPICSLLHAVRWDSLFSNYNQILGFCEPQDALVATSHAGRKAVELILGESRQNVARQCGRDFKGNHPGLMIKQIPLGVDENVFSPHSQQEARQKFGIPLEATVLLYLGRLTERFKADLEPLIIAVSQLVKSGEAGPICLVLSGQDIRQTYVGFLEELASLFGISQYVKIIPNITPNMKSLVYAAADIFVSPVDNIQETFGLTLLEAMASGLPVVASDWSGYKDIVRDGKDGFLVPTYWNPCAAQESGWLDGLMMTNCEHYLAQRTVTDTHVLCDRLSLLVQNRDLRQKLGRAARQRVLDHFTWRSVVSRFGELWKEQIQVSRDDSRVVSAKKRRRALFDTNSIFRHYAAGEFTDSQIIRVNSNILDHNDILKKRLQLLPNDLLAAEIHKIIAICTRSRRTARSLMEHGSSMTRDAILWALKKGFCYISST